MLAANHLPRLVDRVRSFQPDLRQIAALPVYPPVAPMTVTCPALLMSVAWTSFGPPMVLRSRRMPLSHKHACRSEEALLMSL